MWSGKSAKLKKKFPRINRRIEDAQTKIWDEFSERWNVRIRLEAPEFVCHASGFLPERKLKYPPHFYAFNWPNGFTYPAKRADLWMPALRWQVHIHKFQSLWEWLSGSEVGSWWSLPFLWRHWLHLVENRRKWPGTCFIFNKPMKFSECRHKSLLKVLAMWNHCTSLAFIFEDMKVQEIAKGIRFHLSKCCNIHSSSTLLLLTETRALWISYA